MDDISSPESIRGIVRFVQFHNSKTFFAVFQMRLTSNQRTITCTGCIPDIRKGMLLKLTGAMVSNQYGTQYAFKSYELSEPLFSEEIIGYLSSGLIKGVDNVTAIKIYNAFGKDTIKVLDNDPERLLSVYGIARIKANAIIESWREHRDNLETHLLLQKYGISIDLINKLKQCAHERRISVRKLIHDYSYELVYDFDGLTVDTMDQLLMNLCKELYEELRESYIRVECAAYCYLQRYTHENGDLCISYRELIEVLSTKLDIDKDTIDITLRNHTTDNYNDMISIVTNVSSEEHPSQDGYVYVANDNFRELSITRFLLETKVSGTYDVPVSMRNRAALIEEIEHQLCISYNDDQRSAINTVLDNPVTVITGGPGTGKTTIIRGILSIIEGYADRKVLLLAPTGKAAKRMSEATNHMAQTIHLAVYTDENHGLAMYDCVIVDEASMIDNTLMHMLLSRLIPSQRLVLVGDIHQLPSVGPGNILTNIINSELFPVVTLTQIYRQDHGYIIYNAHEINEGRMPALYNEDSQDFFYIDTNGADMSKIDILGKLMGDILPNGIGSTDSEWYKELQILSPMRKGEGGVNNLNHWMQQYYSNHNQIEHEKLLKTWRLSEIKRNKKGYKNKIIGDRKYPFSITKRDVVYAVGDRVINTKNNYSKLVFNGETGYIVKIQLRSDIEERILIDKKFREEKCYDSDYDIYVDFSNGEEDPVQFSYEDLDNLSLAYAMTIHKSQGSEYKYLIMFLNREHWIMQQRNLLYTGITRAKNMVILISDHDSINRSIHNNEAIQRLTLLKERLIHYKDHLEELQKLCNERVVPSIFWYNDKKKDEKEEDTVTDIEELLLPSTIKDTAKEVRELMDEIEVTRGPKEGQFSKSRYKKLSMDKGVDLDDLPF